MLACRVFNDRQLLFGLKSPIIKNGKIRLLQPDADFVGDVADVKCEAGYVPEDATIIQVTEQWGEALCIGIFSYMVLFLSLC